MRFTRRKSEMDRQAIGVHHRVNLARQAPSRATHILVIEHATVIYTPNATRLVRQHRFDGGPFIIAEFVAHDSRLQFRSLNHVRDDTLKPHWPSEVRECSQSTSAFGGIA